MKILHLDSSPFTEGSVSRELSATIVAELCARHHDAVVTYRDLGTTPPPHLSAAARQSIGRSRLPPARREYSIDSKSFGGAFSARSPAVSAM